MMSQIPISLCMIVKNEEKLLKDALESVKTVMGISDIVVVDTGSADKTKEIALECGARVFDFKWCDDFSAPKNYAAQMAENEWIFALDADERVIEADMIKSLELMEDEDYIGTAMMIELSESNIRHPSTRFYNKTAYFFKGNIHEQLTHSDGRDKKEAYIPVLLEHCGYLPELWEEKGKFERNAAMLEQALKQNPDDPYFLFHLGKCYFNFDRDLEKACHYFERVLQKSDNVYLDYVYRTVECYGYALINTGKYREALSLLEVYTEYYKGKPEYRFLMAHIFQNNSMFIEAVECYESCIGAPMPHDTKGITSFLSLYNIGVILECLDMIQDAIEMYESCGDYEPALARLKELTKQRGNYEH